MRLYSLPEPHREPGRVGVPGLVRLRREGGQIDDRVEPQFDLRFDEGGPVPSSPLPGEPFVERAENHESQGNVVHFLSVQRREHPLSGRHLIGHGDLLWSGFG